MPRIKVKHDHAVTFRFTALRLARHRAAASRTFAWYAGTETFPSWLCFAELQYVGGLGELIGAPRGTEGPGPPMTTVRARRHTQDPTPLQAVTIVATLFDPRWGQSAGG